MKRVHQTLVRTDRTFPYDRDATFKYTFVSFHKGPVGTVRVTVPPDHRPSVMAWTASGWLELLDLGAHFSQAELDNMPKALCFEAEAEHLIELDDVLTIALSIEEEVVRLVDKCFPVPNTP